MMESLRFEIVVNALQRTDLTSNQRYNSIPKINFTNSSQHLLITEILIKNKFIMHHVRKKALGLWLGLTIIE